MPTCAAAPLLVRVDGPSAGLRGQLAPLLEGSGPVVLDLRAAELDSVGLGTILSIQRRLELQERRLLLVSTDPEFQSLLERTGTRSAVRLFPDLDSALQHAGMNELAAR